jgi:hypothetical protein
LISLSRDIDNSTNSVNSQDTHLSCTSIMADPEIATKAPENDAAEDTKAPAPTQSLILGDTPAQGGASLGVSL